MVFIVNWLQVKKNNQKGPHPVEEVLTKDEYFEIIATKGVEGFNELRRAQQYDPIDLSGLDFTGKL